MSEQLLTVDPTTGHWTFLVPEEHLADQARVRADAAFNRRLLLHLNHAISGQCRWPCAQLLVFCGQETD